MAPRYVQVDGYWHKLKKKWSDDQNNWANWQPWTETKAADWACNDCDTFQKNKVDTYEGNY